MFYCHGQTDRNKYFDHDRFLTIKAPERIWNKGVNRDGEITGVNRFWKC